MHGSDQRGKAMKWYESNYNDKVAWILDHLEYLNLSYGETVLCLILTFMKDKGLNITYETLINKLDTSQDELDKLLFKLKQKGYLNITLKEQGMDFDLTPLFDFNEQDLNSKKDEDLYVLYEDAFKRPLSPNEMAKISSLSKIYGQDAMIVALRAAQGYNKLNLNYVERYIIDHES